MSSPECCYSWRILLSRQSIPNGCEQRLAVTRLSEEPFVLGLQELRKLVAASDQDHRQSRTPFADDTLQLESVHAGHADIRDQTIDLRQRAAVEQLLG